MGHIHLIGTIHYDGKGMTRLEKALTIERPDLITLETQPAMLAKTEEEWHEKDAKVVDFFRTIGVNNRTIQAITIALETSGYELFACKKYAQQQSIPLEAIDTVDGIETRVAHVFNSLREALKIIPPERIDSYFHNFQKKIVRRRYTFTQRCYENTIPERTGQLIVNNGRRAGLITNRDAHKAEKIRTLALAHAGKIIHVGGLYHFLKDIHRGETLYSHLVAENLAPTRKTLLAYDS
jgi:hypothetical protein